MAEEPISAQNGPYQVELEEGRMYAWCACGRSQRQPFCDGAHKDTGIEPIRFKADSPPGRSICAAARIRTRSRTATAHTTCCERAARTLNVILLFILLVYLDA